MTKRRDPGTLADAIERAVGEVGMPRARELLGLGRSAVYALGDPDQTAYAPMTLQQADQLTVAGATAIAEHLALACGGAFLPPIDATAGELGLQTALLGQECGEALAEMFKALSDKVVTPEEALKAMPEVQQVIAAATTLFALLKAEAAKRGGGAA